MICALFYRYDSFQLSDTFLYNTDYGKFIKIGYIVNIRNEETENALRIILYCIMSCFILRADE